MHTNILNLLWMKTLKLTWSELQLYSWFLELHLIVNNPFCSARGVGFISSLGPNTSLYLLQQPKHRKHITTIYLICFLWKDNKSGQVNARCPCHLQVCVDRGMQNKRIWRHFSWWSATWSWRQRDNRKRRLISPNFKPLLVIQSKHSSSCVHLVTIHLAQGLHINMGPLNQTCNICIRDIRIMGQDSRDTIIRDLQYFFFTTLILGIVQNEIWISLLFVKKSFFSKHPHIFSRFNWSTMLCWIP